MVNRIEMKLKQRARQTKHPGIITTVERCPRCGLGHVRLGVLPAEDGPTKLRGGETHYAVCPVRPEWGVIWFRLHWEPTDRKHEFRIRLEVLG